MCTESGLLWAKISDKKNCLPNGNECDCNAFGHVEWQSALTCIRQVFHRWSWVGLTVLSLLLGRIASDENEFCFIFFFISAKRRSVQTLTLPLTHPREYWNVCAVQHELSAHNIIIGSTRDTPILDAISIALMRQSNAEFLFEKKEGNKCIKSNQQNGMSDCKSNVQFNETVERFQHLQNSNKMLPKSFFFLSNSWHYYHLLSALALTQYFSFISQTKSLFFRFFKWISINSKKKKCWKKWNWNPPKRRVQSRRFRYKILGANDVIEWKNVVFIRPSK